MERSEFKDHDETEKKIEIIQNVMNELDSQFKTYSRPPSAYYDIYNDLAQQLNNLQSIESSLETIQDEEDDACYSLTSVSDEFSSESGTLSITTPSTPVSPSNQVFTMSPVNQSRRESDLKLASFLRIYIGRSTAVIEKKPVRLRELVSSKLKNRNLEIDDCTAYSKDTNLKINWDVDVSTLNEDNIVITEITDEIRHSFEKKTLTLRSCDSCKKRILLNVYACSKCLYVMCRRSECRAKSEQLICSMKKLNASNSLIFYMHSKPDQSELLEKPQSMRRQSSVNSISQQILQLHQLKASPAKWHSETELSTLESPGISPDQLEVKPVETQKFERKKRLNKPVRHDSLISSEIPYKQINIDMSKKVGSGSFGIVHQGRDFYHGNVAVKFLNVQNPTLSQSNAFRNEVAILKSTRHDNILLFIGCILNPYMAIVTEWCPGSSLYRKVHVEEVDWDNGQLLDVARQTSIGMGYLHARGILHRDLKSNNIFLIPKETSQIKNFYNRNDLLNEQDSHNWTVKIGDFGLATVKSTQTNSGKNQPTGSILWMAPEVIRQKVEDPYTQKSDVYSYGVVIYELFTRELPYKHKEQNMILFLVGSGRLKPSPTDCKRDTPLEILELIKSCCEYDRDKRWDFVEINEILKTIKVHKLRRVERSKSL